MRYKNPLAIPVIAFSLAGPAGAGADQGGALCEVQARQILDRLEAEVIGDLGGAQRQAANGIVLDVCHKREAQVASEKAQAVQQAREEEQDKAGGWFTNSGDKAGNDRLKRKQH